MDNNELKQVVIEIFEEVTGSDDMAYDTGLDLFEEELLDSLAIIEVLLEIESRLDISLQPTDLERSDMASVDSLTSFLAGKI